MSNLKEQLLEDISTGIKPNVPGAITATILSDVLQNIVKGFIVNDTFTFPKSVDLSTDDIGKVMMIDDNQQAAVYTLSGANPESPREWLLTLNNLAAVEDPTPDYGTPFFKKTISLDSAVQGDTFTLYFGKELFTATVAATQDTGIYQIGEDADMSIYRTNAIDVINQYDTNLLEAFTNPDDANAIDIIASDPDGRALVFLSDSASFGSFNGVFDTEEFDINPSSYLNINDDMGTPGFDTVDWRNGTTPNTVDEELQLLMDYINLNVSNLSASLTGNSGELQLVESTYQTTELEFSNLDHNLEVVNTGHPSFSDAPEAYPLGKLVGIDEENAQISKLSIETYPLDTPIADVDLSLLSLTSGEPIDEQDLLTNLAKFLVVPADGGNAELINIEEFFDINEGELYPDKLRHSFLGFLVNATDTEVTVLNVPYINHLIPIIKQIIVIGQLAEADEV